MRKLQLFKSRRVYHATATTAAATTTTDATECYYYYFSYCCRFLSNKTSELLQMWLGPPSQFK